MICLPKEQILLDIVSVELYELSNLRDNQMKLIKSPHNEQQKTSSFVLKYILLHLDISWNFKKKHVYVHKSVKLCWAWE